MVAIIKEARVGRRNNRLYKPERDRWATHLDGRRYFDTARAKAWAGPGPGIRMTEADLSLYEAELGVAAVGWDTGFGVGRILGYNPHTNMFRVVGKRVSDGKAGETNIPGRLVSACIIAARMITHQDRLTRPMSGR
jgi:hypothetical protein